MTIGTLPFTCKQACKKSDDAALHHHHAPSGLEYDVRIPSMAQWLRYGIVPSPLALIAAKAEFEDFKPTDLTQEELDQMDDLQDWTVAEMLEPKATIEQVKGFKMASDLKWEPVKGSMPKEDRDDLWQVARRIYRPRAQRIDVAELGPLAALLPFPDGPNSPDVPADVPRAGNGSRSRSRPR